MTTLVVVLTFFLLLSLFYNIKFGKIIFRMHDSIEDALDVCENAYKTMSSILDMPLASDSLETKRFVAALNNVRNSVLIVSNMIADPLSGVEEEKNDATKNS